MFNPMTNGYSLSDIAAVSGNNRNNDNGMWGDGAWWIIILFLFCFNGGMWGNGFGNNAGLQGALTRADLCQDMNFSQLENGVRGIQQGLCDGFYAMNTGLLNGFNGVDNAICNLGYQTQQGFNNTNIALMQGQNALATQLAECCCGTKQQIMQSAFENAQGQNAIGRQISDCCCDIERGIERGFADVNYNMATNTCAIQTSMANNTRDIIDSQNAGTRAILDYLCQEKISTLQNENQALRLAASQQAQNAYLVDQLRPTPSPSYIVCNPYTGLYGGYGFNNYNNGCGFGNNCGCGCN